MRIRRALMVPALLTLAVVAAACGGSPNDAAPPSTSAASGGHDMDDSYSFGAPATPGTTVDRVIEVVQSDDMRFTPDAVEVQTGETVQFDVTNAGEAVHEFVLGDMATQQKHEDEMAEIGGMMASDEPYAISVEPGESKGIVWTFTAAGDFKYACHVPGHYDAGMVADITVG